MPQKIAHHRFDNEPDDASAPVVDLDDQFQDEVLEDFHDTPKSPRRPFGPRFKLGLPIPDNPSHQAPVTSPVLRATRRTIPVVSSEDQSLRRALSVEKDIIDIKNHLMEKDIAARFNWTYLSGFLTGAFVVIVLSAIF